MKVSNVFPGSRNCREVKKLYESAFPAEERYPFWRMLLMKTLNPNVELLAYMRDGAFCGFTMTACSGKYLYINFIAVNPERRSGGIGSRILEALKLRFPGKALLVEVETPEAGTDNYAQRCSRIAFYEKNGFYDLGRSVSGQGGAYMILSTDRDYRREDYLAIFRELSLKPVALMGAIIRKKQR